MSRNHGWLMYLSPEDTLLFASNDAARKWHAANHEAEGCLRVLYRRKGPGDAKRWDPEWDTLAAYAMRERTNILLNENVMPGDVNWDLVEELDAPADNLTSWEFESDIWQELEFASDLLEHEAA